MRSFYFIYTFKARSLIKFAALGSGFILAVFLICFLTLPVYPQQTDSNLPSVVVQPGAPGQPTKKLPPTTRAILPPRSPKDAEFMQGMIMHHAQAVEMTAMIESRTENKAIHLLGARIKQSQADEIKFMTRWLEIRGEPVMPKMSSSHDHKNHTSGHHMMMPGMLTPEQITALRKAKGAEFDRLFLTGMIQHHEGALVMVEKLFGTAGAGQDAELFNFATDVDSSQRAEIKIMQTLLGEKP